MTDLERTHHCPVPGDTLEGLAEVVIHMAANHSGGMDALSVSDSYQNQSLCFCLHEYIKIF